MTRSTSKRRPKHASVTASPEDSSAVFAKLLKETASGGHYSLRLYVTGSTHRSAQAITNIRSLCEEYLSGRYDLEVIDIYQQPVEAASQQIIAAPTLIKRLPAPPKRFVGNLSDQDKVLIGLDLRIVDEGKKKTVPCPPQ